MTKVAIQGIKGSFHDQAAREFFGDDIELTEAVTFRDVFDVLDVGTAEYGVVAVENSLHGSINPVYRLLMERDVHIVGEVRLLVDLYLFAKDFAGLDSFNNATTKVQSHPVALSECDQWLAKHLPLAKRVEARDTADAVRQVMAGEGTLAITSEAAGQLYGATRVAGPINDDPNNFTRFFVLSKQASTLPRTNRTSIILTEQDADKPGVLYDALGVFNKLGINLSKLDSHPIADAQRRYAFYIDFDAAAVSTEGKQALEQLKTHGWNVRILGSYQASKDT